MKIEDQVCSLELAKRLKKLGVKQDSLFYWFGDEIWTQDDLHKRFRVWNIDMGMNSAFTVAELGEMLPADFTTMQNDPSTYAYTKKGRWVCFAPLKEEQEKFRFDFYADTEADARAKMLIHILEYKKGLSIDIKTSPDGKKTTINTIGYA